MKRAEAIEQWAAVRGVYAANGLIVPQVTMFLPDEWRESEASIEQLAMDAAGTLSTDPSSALPTMLTTTIDPDVIRIVFAPLQMAKILGGERKVGSWTDKQRMFPVVEDFGEVSSYGDYANNGIAGINFNYPWFQSYLFQTMLYYGELETDVAGLMKINYVSDLGRAAAMILNRYGNLTYAFGVQNLQNYGLLNNPFLSSYITPAVKAWGGTSWFNGSTPAATANEVYNDILALVEKLVVQGNGTIEADSAMVLAMSPFSQVALSFANSFGVNVRDLLKDNYPNLTIRVAVQYGTQTTQNNQGTTGGNLMQLIATEIDGQQVAYAAFNEKLRAHKIIPKASSWEQKMTSGTWGVIMRIPMGIVGMLGI
jgi:hypothetical protein